jgi:hypothetical protein
MHVRAICRALDRDYIDVNPALTGCTRRGLIIVIGTAQQAGLSDVKRSAPMYALPGTPMLAPVTLIDCVRDYFRKHAQATAVECAEAMTATDSVVTATIGKLVVSGELIPVGTVPSPGKHKGPERKIYALSGATATKRTVAKPKRRERTKSGSGVIAGTITIGRGFRWGSSLA